MNVSNSPRFAFISFILAGLLTSCGSPTTESTVPNGNAGWPRATVHQALSGEFLGCPYQAGDVWQQDISSAKLDPNSAAYIKATQDAGGASAFTVWAPTTNELINAANSSTQLVKVVGKVKWHTPYSPWPW
ncbi:MAG TPA: hypothetical protein VHR97_05260 [Candidatus Baltobacteraceae bacterium]|jgi:hypothetical protein|nr:hypothetical protein [Candidatus Baltobacteraceae bacterium]